MAYQFIRSLVGGTFDHLHAGHQKLLITAFEQSSEVIIGLATDALFHHKQFASQIQSYRERERLLRAFLTERHLNDRAIIVPISDFYGTSLTDKALDAIFITESNRGHVGQMNVERKKRGFPSLQMIIVPYVLGDDQQLISSERIRRGEISTTGKVYHSMFTTKEKFILPEDEREALRTPIGTLFTDMEDVLALCKKKVMTIAVGDVVASSLLHHNAQADISIIDGRTRRAMYHSDKSFPALAAKLHTSNSAGTIEQHAVKTIEQAIQLFLQANQKQLLIVTGEEDLLAIPSIVLAPLDSVVLYGQFGQGVVAVEVSEQKKHHVYELFRKFQ